KASLMIKTNNTYDLPNKASKNKSKYIPIARRQDKPDAIYWLLKNYPGVKDADIIKLIGTTKETVRAIKERTHWNMPNIRPRDPVLLGICSQMNLNIIIEKLKSE
ncbi:MAG: DUF1013 domain-containing protein, partial [Chitinophagaceae bacterium]|nr:DUF1013 domain-containing protein [Chitinophagaceae bacterium]